jgi:hypothetical protein
MTTYNIDIDSIALMTRVRVAGNVERLVAVRAVAQYLNDENISGVTVTNARTYRHVTLSDLLDKKVLCDVAEDSFATLLDWEILGAIRIGDGWEVTFREIRMLTGAEPQTCLLSCDEIYRLIDLMSKHDRW